MSIYEKQSAQIVGIIKQIDSIKIGLLSINDLITKTPELADQDERFTELGNFVQEILNLTNGIYSALIGYDFAPFMPENGDQNGSPTA